MTDAATARTLDRIAHRLRETLPDGHNVGSVYPLSQGGPISNMSTLHIYEHGGFRAAIMFYGQPTPELLAAIGKAFCGDE